MQRLLKGCLSVGILPADNDPAIAKLGQDSGPHVDAPWSMWASRLSKVLVLASVVWFLGAAKWFQDVKLMESAAYLSALGAMVGLAGSIKRGPNRHANLEGVILNVGMVLFIGMALPNPMNACCDSPIASVRRTMHAIQLGVEQYAGDNYGNYPDSLSDPGFKWSVYVPSKRENPYDTKIVGLQIVESNINTAGKAKTAVEVAEKDKRPFRGPGMIRYYIDRSNHSTYALTGSDKDGQAMILGKYAKQTASGWEDAYSPLNYTEHN